MQTKNDILACIAAGPSAIQLLASQFLGKVKKTKRDQNTILLLKNGRMRNYLSFIFNKKLCPKYVYMLCN
jgi:hypothetical protein